MKVLLAGGSQNRRRRETEGGPGGTPIHFLHLKKVGVLLECSGHITSYLSAPCSGSGPPDHGWWPPVSSESGTMPGTCKTGKPAVGIHRDPTMDHCLNTELLSWFLCQVVGTAGVLSEESCSEISLSHRQTVEPWNRSFRWLSVVLLEVGCSVRERRQGGMRWGLSVHWTSSLASPGRLRIYKRNIHLQSIAINRWLTEARHPSKWEGGGLSI